MSAQEGCIQFLRAWGLAEGGSGLVQASWCWQPPLAQRAGPRPVEGPSTVSSHGGIVPTSVCSGEAFTVRS